MGLIDVVRQNQRHCTSKINYETCLFRSIRTSNVAGILSIIAPTKQTDCTIDKDSRIAMVFGQNEREWISSRQTANEARPQQKRNVHRRHSDWNTVCVMCILLAKLLVLHT